MGLYSVSTGFPPAAADINQIINLLTGAYPGFGITVSNRISAGLTGATAGNGFIGGIPGPTAPSTGTFTTGDWGVEARGVVWVCTSGGTSGTWHSFGGMCDSAQASGPVTTTQPFNQQSGRAGFQIWAFDSNENVITSPSELTGDTDLHGFTIVKTGFYLVSSQLQAGQSSTADYGTMILRNGVIAYFGDQFTGASAPNSTASALLYLAAGDQVQCGIYTEAAATTGSWVVPEVNIVYVGG